MNSVIANGQDIIPLEIYNHIAQEHKVFPRYDAPEVLLHTGGPSTFPCRETSLLCGTYNCKGSLHSEHTLAQRALTQFCEKFQLQKWRLTFFGIMKFHENMYCTY